MRAVWPFRGFEVSEGAEETSIFGGTRWDDWFGVSGAQREVWI